MILTRFMGGWPVDEKPSADGLPPPGAATDTRASGPWARPGESCKYPEIRKLGNVLTAT
jgi:hypothetical protein